MFKFIEYCFEINVQGMLGVNSASARPCFDGTTRGLLESNFSVVTACGRSYLSLVCVGYIWRPMRDSKSSVYGSCCDARGRLLVPFLVVFLALVVVSAGKGAWSSSSVATWVGFASNMTESWQSQTGGHTKKFLLPVGVSYLYSTIAGTSAGVAIMRILSCHCQ